MEHSEIRTALIGGKTHVELIAALGFEADQVSCESTPMIDGGTADATAVRSGTTLVTMISVGGKTRMEVHDHTDSELATACFDRAIIGHQEMLDHLAQFTAMVN